SALAVAGDQAVDEPWVAHRQPRPVEPQAGQGWEPHVRDEDVGALYEGIRYLPGLGGGEIQDDAALAPVVELEGRVGGQLGTRDGEVQAAKGIAIGRLDLHHVGTPVGEDGAGRGPCDPQPELEDTDSLARSGHGAPPSQGAMGAVSRRKNFPLERATRAPSRWISASTTQ